MIKFLFLGVVVLKNRIQKIADELKKELKIKENIIVEQVDEPILMSISPEYKEISFKLEDAFKKKKLEISFYKIVFNYKTFYKLSLSDDELKAMLAHEMGHILNNDFSDSSVRIRNGISRMAISLVITIFLSCQIIAECISKNKMDKSTVLFLLGVYFSYVIILFFTTKYMRTQEYKADLNAVSYSSVSAVESMLLKVKDFHIKENPKHYNFIYKYKIMHFFITHPFYDDRIKKIKK